MVKNDDSAQVVIVLTLKEIRYFVVGLFDDLLDPFLYFCL